MIYIENWNIMFKNPNWNQQSKFQLVDYKSITRSIELQKLKCKELHN